MGVLVISDGPKLETYKDLFGKKGYLTDRFSNIEEALSFARESIEESKTPEYIRTKSIDFCFVDREDGDDIHKKLEETLKGVTTYVVKGGQLELFNGKTSNGAYNLNGTESGDIVRIVLDDRKKVKMLNGNLGELGKLLRKDGDKRYQGLKTQEEMMKLEILVVDDEPSLIEIPRRVLTNKGYSVRTASNGEEALELVQGGYKPNLVFTDREMPRMGGEDLARELRIKMPGLPIVMVTGAYEKSLDKNPNLNLVLEKPYNPSSLVEIVGSLLNVESTR